MNVLKDIFTKLGSVTWYAHYIYIKQVKSAESYKHKNQVERISRIINYNISHLCRYN